MNNTKKPINPVSAGIAGAVVGAVGTAVAMTLTDKEKKKQVEKKLFQMKSDVNKVMNQWAKKAEDMKKDTSTTAQQMKDAAEDSTKKIIDKTEDKLEDVKTKADL